MEQIQITQLSPETFRELVSEVIREQIEDFHKDPPDQLITREDLSRKLKISLPTISQYTKDGILKGRKIGNRIYYRWSEVLESAIIIESRKRR